MPKVLTLPPLLFVQFYLEPPVRLREALQLKGLKPESFFTLNHGESRLIASAEGDVFEWFSPGNPVTKTETYFTHPIQTNSTVNKHSEWSQQCFTYWMFAQPLSWWLKCYLQELRLQGKCDCVCNSWLQLNVDISWTSCNRKETSKLQGFLSMSGCFFVPECIPAK